MISRTGFKNHVNSVIILSPSCSKPMHLFFYIRSYTDEWGPKHWAPSRFNHVMKLRQAALKAARERLGWLYTGEVTLPFLSYLTYVASVDTDAKFVFLCKTRVLQLHLSLFFSQFVDSDNLLTNPRVLDLMMAENLTVVAPMLDSRSLYSNFWCGITPQVNLVHLRLKEKYIKGIVHSQIQILSSFTHPYVVPDPKDLS